MELLERLYISTNVVVIEIWLSFGEQMLVYFFGFNISSPSH